LRVRYFFSSFACGARSTVIQWNETPLGHYHKIVKTGFNKCILNSLENLSDAHSLGDEVWIIWCTGHLVFP
jgi:hypothetical protein